MPERRRRPSILALAGGALALLVVAFAAVVGVSHRSTTLVQQRVENALREPRRLPDAWARPVPARAPRGKVEAQRAIDLLREHLDERHGETFAGPAAPGELPYPARAIARWLRVLSDATDDRLPEPPDEIVAWADAHVAEIESSAVPDAPRTLLAVAGLEAWRDRHDVAERRLAQAWALRDPARAPGDLTLSVMRIVHVSDARAWLRELEPHDLRAQAIDGLADEARDALERAPLLAERDAPAWLPGPARVLGVALLRVEKDWNARRAASLALEVRERLLASDPCTSTEDLIGPGWKRDSLLRRVLPASRELRVGWELALLSRDEWSLALTRRILEMRAGMRPAPDCRCAVAAVPRIDGRSEVAVSREAGLADTVGMEPVARFVFDAGGDASPVLATAPAP